MASVIRQSEAGRGVVVCMVAIAMSLVIALSGCGGEQQTSSVTLGNGIAANERNASISDDVSSANEMEESETQARLTGYAQTYSEGLAWVKCSIGRDNDSVYGCIDKKGKVGFYIPDADSLLQPTPFEDGYSYLVPMVNSGENVDAVRMVDKMGSLTIIGGEDGISFVAYGGGYVVTEQRKADFNSNGYIYQIIDFDGAVVEEKKSDEQIKVQYCGHGVFEFDVNGNSSASQLFYCGKSKKWVEETATRNVEFVGDSDTAFIADNYFDPDDTGHRIELVFMTDKGEISRYNPPNEIWDIWTAEVSDGRCVLHDYNDNFYVYNLGTGSLSKMPDELVEKIDTDYYDKNAACFHEGLCVMLAKGADGKNYMEVFDENWELQFEPRMVTNLIDEAFYSDGVLVAKPVTETASENSSIKNAAIIDKNGNTIFDSDDYVSPCIDECFLHSDNNVKLTLRNSFLEKRVYFTTKAIDYLDMTGKPIFEKVDATAAKALAINVDAAIKEPAIA